MAHYSGYRRYYKQLLLVLLLGVVLFTAQKQGWLTSISDHLVAQQPGSYRIDHFIDGDTIAVNMNGSVESVRFIGIDTPETHKPNTPVQCFGPEASAYTRARIGSGRVRLLSDPLSTDRDRYGRLLRYVYLSDGTNLNEALVQNGYAFYYPYFPFSRSGQFSRDEQYAIATHRGLWAACKPTPTDDGGYVSNPLSA